MKLPQGYCPVCENHVEWTAIATASGRLYRCNNCWHHLDEAALGDLQRLNDELKAIEEKRNATLAAYR
jgi:hypothetical protein